VFVSARSLSRRYARALFDVLRTAGGADRAAADLNAMGGAVRSHGELRSVFETPTISVQKKTAIVEALLAAAGSSSPEVRRMVLMLAERDRLPLLPDIADAYAELALEASRVLPAEVTTATPLSDETRAALTQALARATGADIRLSERVDPSIIGGVVAKVGSLVFDASVANQLERMRQRLRAQA
jgi:F-type H+-transporting ATPase subunit delta